MKAFKKFFGREELSNNYLLLKEHIDFVEQTFIFINNHPEVPYDIMALKKYENKWYKVAITWNYLSVWNILTFYRSMEKLKKAKDYFDKPIRDIAEFDQCKNKYYSKIVETLSQYDTHYRFSKMMWDEFNEIYKIKLTNNSEQEKKDYKTYTSSYNSNNIFK